MAENLIKSGYSLVVLDLKRDPMEYLISLGAEGASSAAQLAAESDVLFLCLYSTEQVEDVLFSKGGVVEGVDLKKGETTIIDTSTIHPDTTKRILSLLPEGLSYLDAPVSGGRARAVEGRLTVMVGGEREAFLKQNVLLEVIGEEIFYLGAGGSGHLMKIIHNIISSCNIAILCESLSMGEQAGLEPEMMLHIINSGAASSYMSRTKRDHIINKDFQGPATIHIAQKDLSTACFIADALQREAPMTRTCYHLLQEAVKKGLGGEDTAALYKL